MDKQIELSLSVDYYMSKPNNIAQIRYKRRTFTQNSLMVVLKTGYCVAHCFKTNNEIFTQSEKTNDNFEYTQMIGVDIDDCDKDMETFIKGLERKPTFAYTTFSNGIKGNRFRMIYLFNQKIDSIPLYKAVYNWITEGLNINDNCMRSVSQQMFGTNFKAKWYNSNVWYDVPHFDESVFTNQSAKAKCNFQSAISDQSEKSKVQKGVSSQISKSFMDDMDCMASMDFIMKYRNCYPYFTETELQYKDGYAVIDSNYFVVRRMWYNQVYETNDGTVTVNEVRKYKDGNKRRIRMYNTARILRNIKNDITAEHLAYILYCEREYYYDNSDNILSNERLLSIATEITSMPMDRVIMDNNKKNSFKVDKEYWKERGITPKQAVQIVRGQINDRNIGELYDCSLTDKENIAMMNEYGIKVSLITLKRWRKKNGITKKVSSQIKVSKSSVQTNEYLKSSVQNQVIKMKNK